MTDDFAYLDATAQAELVRRREVTPVELVDAAIERIERLNPALNAVIATMYDLAREAASGRLPDGPFAGVPFLLKDLLAEYAGVPLREGSAFLSGHYVSSQDSELVVRLKRAGLIVLGKTNTPEFGIMPVTEPHLFGPTRNPWDTSRTPGGSSGGSAAAVAAGMVPMAHASDGGGSIRIPAACCGIVGLKPTRGRNPLGPLHGEVYAGMAAEHALTRSVRDCAALLDATSGPDVGDPYVAPAPARPFAREVSTEPGRLRIAFATTAPSGVAADAGCKAAVEDAVALCTELGHEVVEDAPVIDGRRLGRAFFKLWAAGCAWTVEGWAGRTGREATQDVFEPLTWALYEMGRGLSAAEYVLAQEEMHAISRDFARFFLDYDVWLTPALAQRPVPLGTFDTAEGEDPLDGFRRTGQFAPFTSVANASGQPAISLPLYWDAEGLPIGVQFIGRYGDEATLFRLAGQLERARPWAQRRPPISA